MRVEKVCKVREEPAPRFTHLALQLSGTRWDHTVWSVWPHPRPGTFGGFPKHSDEPAVEEDELHKVFLAYSFDLQAEIDAGEVFIVY